MLNRPDVQVTFDASGQATGVTSGGQAAKARFVVGDPSYFPSKARLVAKVVRAIAFLVSDGGSCMGSGRLGSEEGGFVLGRGMGGRGLSEGTGTIESWCACGAKWVMCWTF